MKLLFLVVLTQLLQNACLAEETEPQTDSISNKNILIFPKDRKNYPGPRIIGGTEVIPNSYPFQVGLIINTQYSGYFCGGTLLSTTWVLTAAHCLSMDPLYVLVVLGGHDLTTDEPNSVVLNSTEYIYHKDWDEATFQNDIGLIKLPRTVTLNNIIKTVTWARGSESYAHNVSTAIGWGETDIGRPLILREVTTTILTNEACAAADPVLADLIVPSHLCISGVGTVGTCRGDSGGPLLVDGVQVGITSFGFINCTAAMPSMFTRITEFNDWILEHAIDGSSSHQQLFYSLLLSGVISLVHFLYCI